MSNQPFMFPEPERCVHCAMYIPSLTSTPPTYKPRSITTTLLVIVNAVPHTEGCSQWLAVHFSPKFSSAFSFESYGIVPFVPDILAFKRRNCTSWDHERRQLQGLTSNVCRKYCCLFALYMDRGYTPQKFIALFDACNADRQVEGKFMADFGAEMPRGCLSQCCRSCL